MKTCSPYKKTIGVLVLAVLALTNVQGDITRGTSRAQVVRELGEPDSSMQFGQIETLDYKNGTSITLRNGVVEKLSGPGRNSPGNSGIGNQGYPRSVSTPGASVTQTSPGFQPTQAQLIIPNGTTHWPSAPGDGVCADTFGDTYPFTYGEPPRDVLENHQTYWLDSVEFYYFVNYTFFKSPEYKREDQQALVSYFRLTKEAERKAAERGYQQTQHVALRAHPRYTLYLLLVHLDRANGDYGKARETFIKTEDLSFAKPFSLDSATKPESRPLILMFKDALARIYYCRTRLAKEFPAYCDQDKAYIGVTEFNPDPAWKRVGNKTECPWTDAGWATYIGESDIINNDYLSRADATLIRGLRVTGPNVTGQNNWFIVKNFPRQNAPGINTGIIQGKLYRCKSLGTQPTPNTIIDRIEQRQIELLDFGTPAPPNAGQVTKQVTDARNAARKEARERLRNWKVLNDALALDEQERRYREARQTNPDLTRAAFDRNQRDQRNQQPTRDQYLQAKREKEEHRLENQKQRVAEQATSGDADAKYQLAQAYLQGRGYPQDTEKGNALMKEAAELGDIGAKLYLHEHGPTLNADQTKQWVREAKAEVERLQKEADAGSAKAKRELAKAYTWGYGVSPDPGKAGRLWKESEQADSAK